MVLADVTDADFEAKVIKSPKPVLVDFWAPWCGPCKLAEPVLEELSDDNQTTVFMKVNVDENPQIVQKYQIMSIPTTILFKQGQEIDRQIGFAGKEAFESLLKKGGDTQNG